MRDTCGCQASIGALIKSPFDASKLLSPVRVQMQRRHRTRTGPSVECDDLKKKKKSGRLVSGVDHRSPACLFYLFVWSEELVTGRLPTCNSTPFCVTTNRALGLPACVPGFRNGQTPSPCHCLSAVAAATPHQATTATSPSPARTWTPRPTSPMLH